MKKLSSSTISFMKNFGLVTFGSIICGLQFNYLIVPFGLLSGGLGGITLMLYYLLGWPVYITLLILNVFLFIYGIKEIGYKIMLFSIYATALNIAVIAVTANGILGKPHIDILLAAIFSGVIGGFGWGMVIKAGATLGGMDVIFLIMKLKKNISIGMGSVLSNTVVLGFALVFLPLEITLYTLISIWMGGKIADSIIDGINRDKLVMIVSDIPETIALSILHDMSRGVTFISGEGAYSGNEKRIMQCAVSHYELAQLKKIVLSHDDNAFMVITEAVEVRGGKSKNSKN